MRHTARLPCEEEEYSDGIVLTVRIIEHTLVAPWPKVSAAKNILIYSESGGVVDVAIGTLCTFSFSRRLQALFTFEIYARLRVYGRWYFSLTRLEGF